MRKLHRLPFAHSGGERVVEIMIDSARGTGKTVGDAATLVRWCLKYPGSRFLVARMARESLRSTWEVTFKELVLPSFGIDPSEVERKSLSQYVIRESIIQLRGLDDPQKARSFECNGALFIEGNEIPESTYEDLVGAQRWSVGMKAHFSFIECNPESPHHWLHQRFGMYAGCGDVWGPGRVRLQATHKHNPAYWDIEKQAWTELGESYLHKLRTGMSGVRYQRLFKGDWVQAEGAIFDNYEEHKHVLDAGCEKSKGKWYVVPRTEGAFEPIELLWFAAGQDWGYQSPGVVSVWGFDKDLRSFLVEEVYHSQRSHDWWAGEIQKLHEKYDLWRVVSDPEDAAGMGRVNQRLVARDGRRLLMKANKSSAKTGRTKWNQIMHMHTLFEGAPKAFLLRDARNHQADPELSKKPKSTLEEIPGYAWKPPTREDGEYTDQPIKKNDHGVEAMMYLHWAIYLKDLRPPPEAQVSKPGTMGHMMGYDALVAANVDEDYR